jgi:tryptophan synthase alpha chain
MRNNRTGIMTHIVAGYPSFEDNMSLIEIMASAGVSFIEIQIPFSDPVADGPAILEANQKSLDRGTTVDDCFSFAAEVISRFPDVDFLFMSYYNILFRHGVNRFVKRCAGTGIKGLIVPDIPMEEDGAAYYEACLNHGVAPVMVISPTTDEKRVSMMKKYARWFIYCTSRVGITGQAHSLSKKLRIYVGAVKKTIDLPVAVGFGIDSPERAAEVAAYADIIVIGSKILKIIDANPGKWQNAVRAFLESTVAALRP